MPYIVPMIFGSNSDFDLPTGNSTDKKEKQGQPCFRSPY